MQKEPAYVLKAILPEYVVNEIAYFAKVNDYSCFHAARDGDLLYLIWAHEHGCHWDSHTCWIAARNGHLECLKYAHEHGCPWDVDTCWIAAKKGRLECLKYAHEHGCPWDKRTFYEVNMMPEIHK